MLKGIVKRAEAYKWFILLSLRILWYKRINPSLKEWRFWYFILTRATFCHNFSLKVYTAPFQWRLLIFIGKNLWWRVLEANKKQVPLKSYSLEIRINSVNQILKNKGKVTQTHSIIILTRITDRNILCVYIHAYQITKNWGPGLYDYLHLADNSKYFLGLSNTKSKGSAHILLGEGSAKNLDIFFLLRKR